MTKNGSPAGQHCEPADLSPRELEVSVLNALGLDNNEITRALYLSVNTVKTYVRTYRRRIA